MKLIPVHFLFLILSSAGIAQSYQKTDSAAVFSLIDKAESFFTDAAYDSAIHYCDRAEKLSRSKNFKKGIAYALIEKTDIYMDKDELDRAALYPPQSNAIGLQLKDSLITAISWMQMAQVKMYGGHYDDAVPFFEKSLAYYLEKHPSKYSALAYNDFGYTWGEKGNLLSKAKALIKALEVYESLDLPNYGERAAAFNNLSTVYYELNDRDKAIEYGKKSIYFREKAGDIARLSLGCCNLSQMYLGVNNTEAIKYQELCVKYAEQSKDESRIIHAYVTSSLIATSQKDTKKSMDYELKAIALLEKNLKEPSTLARRYISVGMGQTDSLAAITYFNKAMNLAQSLRDKFNLRDVYYQLAIFYKNHGDYNKAYNFYTRHIVYRDSIVNNNTALSIADLEKKYETEKKDNLITRLNAEQTIKQLEIEKQKGIITRDRLKALQTENEIIQLSQQQELRDARIKQQGEELEKQLLLAQNSQQELLLAQTEKTAREKQLKAQRQLRNLMIAGMVLLVILGFVLFNRYQLKKKLQHQNAVLTVRNNIARDLHDEIGSTLTSIKILSQVSHNNLQKDQEKASRLLAKITEQSAQVQQGMSDIVWAITPDNDKLENLVARMREYIAHTLEPKNIETVFEVGENILSQPISMEQRRDFFLIFKEAVNNAAKYSSATHVLIRLTGDDNKLLLIVQDKGIGFDSHKTTSSNGLRNMRTRTELLGGKFNIHSKPGVGTRVEVEIPAT